MKSLVLANGAYGVRAAQILKYMDRPFTIIDKGDYSPPRSIDIKTAIDLDPDITHVFVVHCEIAQNFKSINEISEATASMGENFSLTVCLHLGR